MNLAAGCHVRGTKNKIRDKTKVPRRDKSRFDFEEVARKVAEQRRFVSAVTEYAELDKETKKMRAIRDESAEPQPNFNFLQAGQLEEFAKQATQDTADRAVLWKNTAATAGLVKLNIDARRHEQMELALQFGNALLSAKHQGTLDAKAAIETGRFRKLEEKNEKLGSHLDYFEQQTEIAENEVNFLLQCSSSKGG
ncbi:uncharacterized protein LOC144137941 [Haemaphysalis longicornis]